MAEVHTPRVLVVEHDERLRRAICTILATAGYELVDASDRKEALDALGRPPKIDLVVLDLDMPQFDGIAVLDSLDEGPGVILLSAVGLGFSEGIIHRYPTKVVSFLAKPIREAQLLSAVRSAMKSRSGVTLS